MQISTIDGVQYLFIKGQKGKGPVVFVHVHNSQYYVVENGRTIPLATYSVEKNLLSKDGRKSGPTYFDGERPIGRFN